MHGPTYLVQKLYFQWSAFCQNIFHDTGVRCILAYSSCIVLAWLPNFSTYFIVEIPVFFTNFCYLTYCLVPVALRGWGTHGTIQQLIEENIFYIFIWETAFSKKSMLATSLPRPIGPILPSLSMWLVLIPTGQAPCFVWMVQCLG